MSKLLEKLKAAERERQEKAAESVAELRLRIESERTAERGAGAASPPGEPFELRLERTLGPGRR